MTINEEMNPRYLLTRAGLVTRPSTDGGVSDPGQVIAYSALSGWKPLGLAGTPLLAGDECRVGTNLAIAAQKSSGRLHAWSALKGGEWRPCPNAVVTGDRAPVARGNVAALQGAQAAYAFGAESGEWAVLGTPPAGAALHVTPNLALVSAAGDPGIHAFSGIHGTAAWASYELKGTGATRHSGPGTNVVVAGRTGGRACAYNAIRGAWVPVPDGSPLLADGDELVAYSHVGIVRAAGVVHAFNANTHQWYSAAIANPLAVHGAGAVALVQVAGGYHAFSALANPIKRSGQAPGWHEFKPAASCGVGLSA
ncbi:MAG TPA: hypothetical protein VNP72_01715 [Longimicrobium sp.]|nr:hypothetical protein [Longimicrobium sp.]